MSIGNTISLGLARTPARLGVAASLAAAFFLAMIGCDSRAAAPPTTAIAPDPRPPVASTVITPPYRVFVTNEMSGDMTVIDGASDTVIATVALGKRPRGIQVSPDGTRLYVALSGSPIAGPDFEGTPPPADKAADGIGVVDLRTLQLVRVIRGVSDPEQLVVHPDGRRLYVASEDTGTAVIMDAGSGTVLASLPVGGEPEGVGISPDGRFVYMTSEEDHHVAVIDTTLDAVTSTFGVGKRPRHAEFSSDGSRAYVTGEFDASVSVVDVGAHRVLGVINLPGDLVRPMDAALAPDGATLYVTTGRGRLLYAIDAATQEPRASVQVGQRPWGLGVSPDGRRIYTANGPSNDVSVIDAASMTVIRTITAGTRPWGIAVVE